MTEDCAFLRHLFDSAVAAASPAACMPPWLGERPAGKVIVVGAGKAAAAMAMIVEQQWAPPLDGLVIVPDGHGAGCDVIEVIEASHPVPDERGVVPRDASSSACRDCRPTTPSCACCPEVARPCCAPLPLA